MTQKNRKIYVRSLSQLEVQTSERQLSTPVGIARNFPKTLQYLDSGIVPELSHVANLEETQLCKYQHSFKAGHGQCLQKASLFIWP